MNITRRYGSAPYSVVLVHGGPGAKGSLKPMAEELSLQNGVLEPFQTRYSIEELIQELHEQVCCETDGAVTFVGAIPGTGKTTCAGRVSPFRGKVCTSNHG